MSALMSGLRFVGDLDDRFYDDERQRDVWNEASAVGFQALQWCVLIAAAILPWAAGRTGAWISLGLLATWITVSALTSYYARRLDVDVTVNVSYLRPRVVITMVVYLVGAFGTIAQLLFDVGSAEDRSTVLGAVVGAPVGAAAAALMVARGRRRARKREAEEDAREAAEL